MEEHSQSSLSQQQQLILQQKQQQQMFLMQHIQQQKQQQQQAMTRFPSNIDAHLLSPGNLARPVTLPQQQQQSHQSSGPNTNSVFSNLIQQQQQQQQQQVVKGQNVQKTQQQQQEASRSLNMVELQMAYQDAWRVCHPDFKRPFSSIEDACERLVAYHVVADYEAEEDDRILSSDRTGRVQSRSQQWDNNIAAKISEFVASFEKQAAAFNIICRKRSSGEFRSEERLMVEQGLLQEERRAMAELRAEIEARDSRLRPSAALDPHPVRPGLLRPLPPAPWPAQLRQRDDRHPTNAYVNPEHGAPHLWTGTKNLDLNSR